MMGKKEYQLFADAVSLIENEQDIDKIKGFLFPLFSSDNPRFDEERFNEWVLRRKEGQTMKGTNYNPRYMPLGVK